MASKDKKPSTSNRGAGGIRTLADLNRRPAPDSDSDSDNPQEYYTGGEKRLSFGWVVFLVMINLLIAVIEKMRYDSFKGYEMRNWDHPTVTNGMLVQGPPKGNDVDDIFDQVRQLGAVEGPLRPSSSSTRFTGTGRLLSGESVAAAPQEPETVVHNIVFWRNGFTVNDGPLRSLDDPANESFLESIRKSDCPKELEPANRATPVHVNLIRRVENFPEPERRASPFQGVGRTLGGSSTPDPTAVATPLNSAPRPSQGLVLDQTLPSTSIQLRLADGTRMVARFNLHHTIADIHAFIDASRPGGGRSYQLQSAGVPPKPLNDWNQTIEQAGLANSVVIQKP
ncbi:Plant UBX domain-containing protein [Drosera capensis]